MNIGGTATKLGDLKIVGYTKDGDGLIDDEDFSVCCQFLDGNGRTIGNKSYFWLDYDADGREGQEGVDWMYGWYDIDVDPYVSANNVDLPLGEGIWLYCNNSKYSVQGAGQVPDAPVAVTLRSGGLAKMVVNAMPANLMLGDMWITGYGKDGDGLIDDEDFSVCCQFLDGNGRTIGNKSYFWLDYDADGREGQEGVDWMYGWYDIDTDPYVSANNIEFPAGTSVWMYSNANKYSANIKSPIQKEVE